jgi:hypothetical protein
MVNQVGDISGVPFPGSSKFLASLPELLAPALRDRHAYHSGFNDGGLGIWQETDGRPVVNTRMGHYAVAQDHTNALVQLKFVTLWASLEDPTVMIDLAKWLKRQHSKKGHKVDVTVDGKMVEVIETDKVADDDPLTESERVAEI